jgi:hypothetical protein
MKRHGTYTEIFRNDRWAIFKAQGGLNQVLAKNTITTETHAFARYTHKPAFFAETGTPHNWLPAYVRAPNPRARALQSRRERKEHHHGSIQKFTRPMVNR